MRENYPVLIVLGIGGKPSNPDELYILPIKDLNKPVRHKSVLGKYRKKIDADFFFDQKSETLNWSFIMDNQIEICRNIDDQTKIEVKFEQETGWLNQKQVGARFDKDSDTISLHLKNTYKNEELDETSTTEES